ncbi:B-cell receptor CD22-like [Xenopus laevis]|uniref:B-cell receptor CD22-like n=1 Tax=Xenopus laevis TaxID=8355 RepID=A0A8J1L9K8_XENLA|nr:B-cell receptor CD22-like [Xenopus laevis]
MMTRNFFTTIMRVLILILIPGTLGQRWSFSFPRRIQALKGSCVEIPCSYTRPASQRPPNVIWYLYNNINYIRVFDSQDSRKVSADYRSRTKLVLNAPNSCTLHISNVRREDENDYYPGVDDENVIDPNARTVHISVTDVPNNINLQGPGEMAEGTPVIIRCSVEHSCGSDPPTLHWNKRGHPVRTGQQHLSGGTWEALSEINYSPTYEDDRTEIQCSVAYPNGQTSHQATPLNIMFAPKEVQLIKYEKQDGSVELKCSFSSSSPNVTHFTWLKNDLPFTTQTQPILTLENAGKNSGEYRCIAHNRFGNSSCDKQITIQFKGKYKHKDSNKGCQTPGSALTMYRFSRMLGT